MLKFLVFADSEVGSEIVKFICESGDQIECLVLNSSTESNSIKSMLEQIPRRSIGSIIYSNDFDRPETIDELRRLAPDLGILAWWPFIIREPILSIPRIGFLNFHPSLLPYNRGKHPNFWSLVDETPFGVTIHWVDEKIDHGDIAFQSRVEKSWEDTGATLYRRAQTEIVRLFLENYPRIRCGEIPRRSQEPSEASFHRASELEHASKLDLERKYTARHILNLLRARTFAPHPACSFSDGADRYEVRVEITKVESESDGG